MVKTMAAGAQKTSESTPAGPETGAAAIARVIADAGYDMMFGLPGGMAGLISDEIHIQGRVPFVLVRHEQNATIMADVYGRLTGRPGIALAQGVFMASNGGIGIMEARMSSSPMLVLTDSTDGGSFAQYPIMQNGTGNFGTINLPQIFDGMAKYVSFAATPKEAVQATQFGLRHAAIGRPGPSVVLARAAALKGTVDTESAPLMRPTAGYLDIPASWPDPEAITRAASAIAAARHPVIVAGVGVHLSRAHDELQRLAHRLGAPVATSPKGRSAMSDDDALSLGLMGGMGRVDTVRAFADADAVIVVGSRLSVLTTDRHNKDLIDPDRQVLVQIDIEPTRTGWAFPVHHALVGDAAVTLRQLLSALEGELAGERREPWFVASPRTEPAPFDADAVNPTPRRIIEVLNATLPADTVVVVDAGKNKHYMVHDYRARTAGGMIVPGGIAPMGWTAPATVAAKLLMPSRPCFGVAGDGGFAMTTHALATAVQQGVAPIFLVMNDSAMMWHAAPDVDYPYAAEFSSVDFVSIARGYGADGLRVEDAAGVAKAVGLALQSKKPFVIDVVTDRETTAIPNE
jgi:acetolactate synthase I/II/III large subunit